MDLFPWNKVDKNWHPIVKRVFEQCDVKTLEKKLQEEYEKHTVYPPKDLIFNAFIQTPFSEIKVVIIGQDPYHNPGEAHGLCFSVPNGIKHPPSLENILKEVSQEYNLPPLKNGDLTPWAHQGVFLLNSILTVRKNEPESHKNLGWEKITDGIIYYISKEISQVVFMLWGSYAHKKEPLIDSSKHLILKASHPSPYSSHGFLGCGHFKKANEYLIHNGKKPINWGAID